MSSLTSKALALIRPTLRGNSQLAVALPIAEALAQRVLLLSISARELEAAVSNEEGRRYLQERLTQPDFQRELCRVAKLTLIEIARITVRTQVHPEEVIVKAIERTYPANLEIRINTALASVLPRAESERMGVLLERVSGTIVYALCTDGNGEKFLRERFQQKLFREAVAVAAGIPRSAAGSLTLFKPRRVTPMVLKNELNKVFPDHQIKEQSDLKIRTQVQRVRAEREQFTGLGQDRRKPLLPTETRNMINTVVGRAYLRKASDIRMFYDLSRRQLCHEVCIDGDWHNEKPYPIDVDTYHSIMNLLRQDAKIASLERDVPHDGHIRFDFVLEGRRLAFDGRVNILPKEDTLNRRAELSGVTFRLFRDDEEIRPIEEIGFLPFQTEMIYEKIAAATDGLLLVGGPTNSGKNGTLKAITALLQQNYKGKRFASIEDPVEVGVPSMYQVSVSAKKQATDYLPALLRSNFQGIQMTEIRDPETARFAFMAADTGIYTQATIHIRNPFQVIPRLSKYGISPNEISETLIAVIYQRLLPRLCRECAIPEDWELLWKKYPRLKAILEYWQVPLHSFRPKRANKQGCPHCIGGYRGRIGIFEIWNPELQRHQLSTNPDINEIRETALALGHWSMLRAGLCHAFAQIVDIESVMKATNGVDPVYEGVEGYRYKDVEARIRDMEAEAAGVNNRKTSPEPPPSSPSEPAQPSAPVVESDIIEAEFSDVEES